MRSILSPNAVFSLNNTKLPRFIFQIGAIKHHLIIICIYPAVPDGFGSGVECGSGFPNTG